MNCNQCFVLLLWIEMLFEGTKQCLKRKRKKEYDSHIQKPFQKRALNSFKTKEREKKPKQQKKKNREGISEGGQFFSYGSFRC